MRWQDLNDRDKEGRRRYWLHGRTWLGAWSIEWCLPHWELSVSVAIQMPQRRLAGFHVTGGPFGLYVSNTRRNESGGIRRFDLSWFGGSFRLALWDRQWESRSTDPWYVRGVRFDPMDFVFGRRRHSHEILSEYKEVLVPMPEGCYRTQMRLERRTWKRPRWPWKPLTIVQQYVEIKIDGGIPFEGKGENSWDCGEDGLWGCSSTSWSYEKAIGHVVESVLKNRKRYGGSWQHRDRVPTVVTR